MEERNQSRRPRRDAEQPQQKSESLIYGKNPVTELLKSGSGVDTVLIAEGMAPAVAAYYTALAKEAGAQLYLTGDVKYHDAQEAIRQGIVVADGGHFGTEFPVVADLCQRLEEAAAKNQWNITCETDPTSKDMLQYM